MPAKVKNRDGSGEKPRKSNLDGQANLTGGVSDSTDTSTAPITNNVAGLTSDSARHAAAAIDTRTPDPAAAPMSDEAHSNAPVVANTHNSDSKQQHRSALVPPSCDSAVLQTAVECEWSAATYAVGRVSRDSFPL